MIAGASMRPRGDPVSIGIDNSVLLSYYQSRSGGTSALLASAAGGTGGAVVNGKTIYAPTAPWSTTSTAPKMADLTKSVLAGHRFIDENAAQLDLPGASDDYKKLFALYQGLNALNGVVEQADAKTTTDLQRTSLDRAFTRGLKDTVAYADTVKLDGLRLTRGAAMITDRTTVGVPKPDYTYTTDTIQTGQVTDPVADFQGPVAFTIQVKRLNVTQNLNIDLADMGSTTRSMSNVTSFINAKLSAAGLNSRFAVSRTPGEPKVVKVGTTSVTLPANADKLAFKITADSAEQLTFSAAATNPAVYVTSVSGNPNPDKDTKTDDAVYQSKLMKMDTGVAGDGAQLFNQTLETSIKTVRASQTTADGSVYVLADVNGAVDGQTLQGTTDVALIKYDSAGKIVFTRTLGAADDAEGLNLAVSSDGKVAVAGKVTGDLLGATNGALNSGSTTGLSDSFVTLYDAKGDEVWTQRRGALQQDEATAVGFGADGTVYVGGRTKSTLPGGGSTAGGWDGYLTGIATTAKGAPSVLFTKQFGGTGDEGVSGLVVNGSQVIIAGKDSQNAVLRSFDVTGGVVTDGATRDLGDLQGGNIAGLKLDGGQLYIAGATRNGALSVGNGGVAYTGGMDAYAARLSTDLTSTASDSLSYFGGAEDDTVTTMDVANGQVWVAGKAGLHLPGVTDIGANDGYMAQINLGTGTIAAAQRITGKDGYTTPTTISVDATGASALDKLGLPKGTLTYTDSQKITSATSARAGDQFQIRTSVGGALATVTLDANDTLDTLAAKVRRAGGFKAKVEVVSDSGVKRLKISPATATSSVEILPGKGSKDLLAAIGLAQGVVRNTVFKDGKSQSADGKGNVYGLSLTTDLDISTTAARKATLAALSTALGAIRSAYRDLESAAKPKPPASTGATGGPVPAYLTNQVANYQAALDRLTGGG
jgi:hypothetical protein